MKINVFDIKFKTNPNQPIDMTKDPFILEVPDDVDVNSYIATWFNDNYDAVPTFDWTLVDEDAAWLNDIYDAVPTSDWPLVDEDDPVEKIRMVLRRYFETNDNGKNSPDYDPNFSAQDAINEIHDIIGNI